MEKMVIKNSKANNYEKSIIAGHYIFQSKIFRDKRKCSKIFEKKKNLNLDKVLKKEIKKSILRYLYNFNLVE